MIASGKREPQRRCGRSQHFQRVRIEVYLCLFILLGGCEKITYRQWRPVTNVVDAVPASPLPFREVQEDGSLTPLLYIWGDARQHIITDENSFTVIQDNVTNAFVYAKKNEETGELVSSGYKVGDEKWNEVSDDVETMVQPTESVKEKECGKYCENGYDMDNTLKIGGLTVHFCGRRELVQSNLEGEVISNDADASSDQNRMLQGLRSVKGNHRNLVILLRFSDHKDRELPSVNDYNVLFNKKGGHPDIAPTGSVRDVYSISSYDQYDLVSTVVGWVDLPETEIYYADGKSGGTTKIEEAFIYALDRVNRVSGFSFSHFDSNDDQLVDSVVFVHSGYGAESGATDCTGQKSKDRIWSHQWKLSTPWESSSGVSVENYFTASGLFDYCGDSIARIGTISHEMGHTLGLPDLYLGGSGIGSYGLMGNSWGFDGSQHFPPPLSPWSKIMVGWLTPNVVSRSGRYTLKPSLTNPQVIKIDEGFRKHEYLLIEYRKNIGFDEKIPKSGLFVYHIDEYASFYKRPGWYGQECWPENGNHYRVALLQSDGDYDLEQGNNRGDITDAFGPGDYLGPGGTGKDGGPYPNTDSYQRGRVKQTGIEIHEIVESNDSVSFTIDFPGDKSASSSTTSTANAIAAIDRKELVTTFRGETGSYGSMFDIVAGTKPVVILSLDLHVRRRVDKVGVKVYTKSGSHVRFESSEKKWKLICSTAVEPGGFYKRTVIDDRYFQPVTVNPGETQAFYVVLDTADLRYSRGTTREAIYQSNAFLQILEGTGVGGHFGKSFTSRVFNGFVKYSVVESDDDSSSDVVKSIEESHMLRTNYKANNGNYGQFFNLKAKKSDVTVTGMNIHLKATTNTPIEVYTKTGTYQGHERDQLAWELVCKATVRGQGQGSPTIIPDEEFTSVKIEKNAIQAFYVTAKYSSDLLYTSATRAISKSDEFISIKDGAGITYPFGYGNKSLFSPREFNGSVRYISETEEPKYVSSRPGGELLTTYSGGNGSYGAMFNIKAKKRIRLRGVKIHIQRKNVQIDVYTKDGSFIGYQQSPDSWTLMCRVQVQGLGMYKQTSLPSECFDGLTMNSGETLGFYVTLNSLDLVYTNDTDNLKLGGVYKQNNDIQITIGSGVGSYPLSRSSITYDNRIINGSFKYDII